MATSAVPISVFEFTSPREYLAALHQQKRQRNPGYSLRAWSRQLGFRSATFLGALLRGERKITAKTAAQIAREIPLEDEAARYFELLALVDGASTPSEKEIYLRHLQALRPGQAFFDLSLESFRLIADWYHLAILEMTHLKGFDPAPEKIARRLGGKVPPALVEAAIERLVRLGFLVRTKRGKLERVVDLPKIGDKVPSEAIRQHHAQMLDRAHEALREQPMEQRDFRGTTIPIRKEKIEEAKVLIREFHARLQKLSSATNADEVYRFNTLFFSLTPSKEDA